MSLERGVIKGVLFPSLRCTRISLFELFYLVSSVMAPNLASSQHDLIHDMIVDKKLKTRQMTNVAECSERSIKANTLKHSLLRDYKSSSKWWWKASVNYTPYA